MTHLDIAEVVDFVRGLARATDCERVERHLANGCEPCRTQVALMRRVATLAIDDGRWEPPTDAVSKATAIFPASLPRKIGFAHRILARLVFDSFSQPLPVGVRSGQRLSRQVMYRAGDVYVDLRVDHEHGQRHVSLVGQIAGRGVPAVSADVCLMDGHEAIARVPLNEFGEFQMQYVPGRRMRLRIPLDAGERAIEVPLARLANRRSGQARKPDKPR